MHHSRRKSGHGSANTSMTDVRKAAVTASDSSRYKRPSATSRRSAGPQTSPKPSRSSMARESQWQDDRYWDDDRDSFPQYCMTCEKQFVTQDEKSSYCSEACRKVDQMPSSKSTSRSHGSGSQSGHYPFYAAGNPEPRDIIPRASPSRPNSMHYSSPPTTPGAQHHSSQSSYYQQQQSAISALRSLTIHQPPSPPSPSGAGVWPFTRSAATSPSTSYTRGTSGFFSSTYDAGYAAAGAYNYSSSGMERPLPSRRPGAYSRPKSIELVTPMVGR